VLFDELIFLHHHQREKTDAVLLRDGDLVDFSPGSACKNGRYSEGACKRAKGTGHGRSPEVYSPDIPALFIG
jgi:hypothetical protein